jgi:hypothetical protein
LDGALAEFSETWPRSGLMRNGTAYQLPPLVRLTDETDCGLWRTPDASIVTGGAANAEDRKRQGHAIGLHDQVNTPTMWPTPTIKGNHNKKGLSAKSEDGLATAVKMWPTPTSRDWKDGSAQACRNVPSNGLLGREVFRDGTSSGGSLNPAWVEFLMGLPTGWTALEPSVTPSSRKSRKSSGGR